MPKKLLIFDFDGVIADSAAESARVHARIFPEFGKEVPFSDYTKWYQAKWENNWLNAGLSEDELPLAVAKFWEYFDYEKVSPHRKLKEQLLLLGQKSLMVIGSTTPESRIRPFLIKHDLEKSFAHICGSEGKHSCKREIFRGAVERFGFSAAQSIVIGDTAADIIPARELGCKTAGVTYGWYSPERMEVESPDILIKSPESLAAALSGLLL